MKVNFWTLPEMSRADRERIVGRAEMDISRVMEIVRPIISDVRLRGDAALIDCAKRFDDAEITGGLKATDAEFEAAYRNVHPDIIEAIRVCAGNVRRHHEQQMKRVEPWWMEEVMPGVLAGEKVTPIPSAGLYVPRGKGAFPSVMYMLCTPARIAGVETIAVCTPPTPDGGFDAASLIAADISGVRDVYKAGGAQAIAALAYGTETIPAVAQVNGPGSPYVVAAKRLLSHVIDPGLPSGPSEAIILADASADPWNTALDLLNEAEHGPDSASLLVTDSPELAERIRVLLPTIAAKLPPQRRAFCEAVLSGYGGIIVCRDLNEAIAFCNDYGAEHLLVKIREPAHAVAGLKNAGEILIGETTPIALANYGTGVNAVLPTGRSALTSDCTSVWAFLKRTSLSHATAAGYAALRPSVERLAEYEGFAGHALTLRERNDVPAGELLGPATPC
ncbi:MAG TPA: histidinol dehydrogenase [Rhizomicrobium sp.]|jgi:histidinol dehydrogenase|nr:histidinol dehydrogenase [Rhizomicrobium sp.]